MTTVSPIRAIDMRLIDDLFDMGGGYVLDFSDRTFGEFFNDELNIDIDESRYSTEGTSKAKRLRYFRRLLYAEGVTSFSPGSRQRTLGVNCPDRAQP
jgi:hypothetical protein